MTMDVVCVGGRLGGRIIHTNGGGTSLEHPLDFGRGQRSLFVETYWFDHMDDQGRLVAKYGGLRRIGGIRTKFDPSRLV